MGLQLSETAPDFEAGTTEGRIKVHDRPKPDIRIAPQPK